MKKIKQLYNILFFIAKDLINLLLVLLVFLAIFIAIIINYPNFTVILIDKFSHYQVQISNIDIDIIDKKFILSSKEIYIKNKKFSSKINNLIIEFDFKKSYYPVTKLVIDTLNSKIYQKGKGLLLFENTNINNLNLNYFGVEISTSLSVEKINNQLIINGFIKKNIDIDALKYVKTFINKKVFNYLNKSLKSGSISNVSYNIVQNKRELILNVKGKINNGKIKFNTHWPSVSSKNINFIMNNNNLILNFDHANIANIIAKGSVKFDWKDDFLATINVTTKTKIKTIVNFLQNTPLSNKLKQPLDRFSVTGDIEAGVNINFSILPLDKEPQVIINAKLINNQVKIFDGKITIDNINAKLKYDKKLLINGFGRIFNKKTNIDINYDSFFSVNLVNSNGHLSINNSKDKKWFANLISDDIFGEIKLDFTANIPKIYLNNININSENFNNNTDINKNNLLIFNIKDIPNFDLVTNNITINNKLLPNISSSFIRKKNSLHIKNFQFDTIKLNNKNIKFNGMWVDNLISFYTTLNGNELNSLFDSFNINEHTTGGKFKLDIRGVCRCNPWEISLAKISGYTKIYIEQGVFTEQDANIGRILSLLNINAIRKRFAMDLDDVVDKGFSYNNINAEMILAKGGLLQIKNFQLDSSSSKIELIGTSHIVTKKYNLKASVIPAIKDSIPIIAALAGGGMGGLTIWLADKLLFKEKLLNSILDNVIKFDYKITGDWQKPKIENIKSVASKDTDNF